MYRFSIVLVFGVFITVESLSIERSNADKCLHAPCGKGATCSVTSNLILCRCPDGYSGDGFSECVPPLSTTTTTSTAPPTTETDSNTQTTTAVGSTLQTTRAQGIVVTSTENPNSNSNNNFLSTSSQRYEIVNRHQSSGSNSNYQPVPTIKVESSSHQSPQKSSNNEDILTQFPSAPPTLSHYAHSNIFQQRIQAQPIQFNEMQRYQFGQPQPPSTSFPAGATIQNIGSSNSNNGNYNHHAGIVTETPSMFYEIFSDLNRGQSPQPEFVSHSHSHRPSMANNGNYNYPENIQQHQSNKNDNNKPMLVSHQHQQQNSMQHNFNPTTDYNQNIVQFGHHHHQQQQQHNNRVISSGNNNDESAALEDYRRVPILGTINNVYPVSSNGGSSGNSGANSNPANIAAAAAAIKHQHQHLHNHPHPEDEHDDEMSQRDPTFIKDPLGKYEKCHTVNNVVVCAENSNNELEKSDINLRVETQTKPSETRRLDSRPTIHSDNNNYIPINTRHPEESYYPSSQRNKYPTEPAFPQFPSYQQDFPIPSYPNVDFTSTGVDSTISASTIMGNDENQGMCQKFCGELSVCRIILGRPVCGCPEGHTGDPAIKCFPIQDSKFDMKSCQRHTDCSAAEICTESRCIDPCLNNDHNISSNRFGHGMALLTNCGINASCKVIEHTQLCSCNEGFNGNPYRNCS